MSLHPETSSSNRMDTKNVPMLPRYIYPPPCCSASECCRRLCSIRSGSEAKGSENAQVLLPPMSTPTDELTKHSRTSCHGYFNSTLMTMCSSWTADGQFCYGLQCPVWISKSQANKLGRWFLFRAHARWVQPSIQEASATFVRSYQC